MADYFGATADPNYGYSPYSGQLYYGSYPPSTLPFSAPPGPGNPATVEQIHQRVQNLHPEQMATLADQWQNAWAFLADVHDFVLKQSTVLRDEAWQSPAARDAFLQKGPGETLAYLGVWMDAAQKNVTALRHLTNVSVEARQEMDLLLADYERELREAQEIGFGEHLGAFFTEGVGWNAAALEKIEEDQGLVQEKFRYEAQRLAQHYGNQFFDYIAMLSSGVGPPVQPLNAVLSQPAGVPGFNPGQFAPGFQSVDPPGLGSPGGLPSGQNLLPGVTPPGLLPPGAGLPLPGQPGVVPPGSLPAGVAPPGTLPPGVPLPQPGGNGVLPPGVLPPGVVPPGTLPPGTLPPGTLPPGTGTPGSVPPGGTTVIPPAVRPSLPPQIVRPGGRGPNVVVPPGGLPPGRTIRRPSGQGAPVVPPGGRQIGRPAAIFVPPPAGRPGTTGRPGRTTPGTTPPPQTGRPGRTTPGITPPPPATGRPGDRRTPGTAGTIPTPQTGRPGRGTPAVTPPPPQTGRPGDRRTAKPGGPNRAPGTPAGTDTFGRPPASAAPPVLKSPVEDRNARPGSEAEIRSQATAKRPGGTAPPVLNRPTSPAAPPPYKPTRRDRGGAAWSDLFGAEEARKGAGSGVIDAPERARPEGGPWGLRSRAATRPETPAETGRAGTVAPELGKRRGGGDPVPVREDHELVTDEQAFGVRTPGGGVVTGRGDEPPEEEVRRAFRGR